MGFVRKKALHEYGRIEMSYSLSHEKSLGKLDGSLAITLVK